MKIKIIFCTLILLYCGNLFAAPTNTNTSLDAGPLRLDIYISHTAHMFHVVDQISQWSEFCHRQYLSYFEGLEGGLSKNDLDLLAQHKTIRKVHGWGQGLEQTFYTSVELDLALDLGVKKGYLTKEEAETERRILTNFQKRVELLMSEEMPTLKDFEEKLVVQQSNLTSFANDISKFVGCDKLVIPVYLIANPNERDCGGGFNGGSLTLEIAKNYDMYPTLLHELFHAFLRTKQEQLEKAASSVHGLDIETLSEGIAYAYNPGIIHADDSDPLLSYVSTSMRNRESIKTNSYTRFNMYGLALRPLLKESLFEKKQKLEEFLPKATDAWLVLIELYRARSMKSESQTHDYRKDPKHSIFLFGFWDKEGCQSLMETSRMHLFGRNHNEKDYKEMLTKNAKPGDTIIMLISLDGKERIPVEFSDLIPTPWSEIENRVKQEGIVFIKNNARDMNVFLLATRTVESLKTEFRQMVAEKKFIVNSTEKSNKF